MKTIYFSIFGAIILLFSSCNKEDEDDNLDDTETRVAVKDNNQAEALFSYIDQDVNTEMKHYEDNETKENEEDNDPCADVTYKLSPDSTYVSELVIDYGDGCEFRGRVRTGKIKVVKTGKIYEVGTVETVTFEDYTVNGYQVDGVREATVSSFSNGELVRDVEVRNAKITSPTGGEFTWETDRTVTFKLLQGKAVVTGTSSGVNQIGISFEAETTKDLELIWGCPHIVSGEIEVRPNGFLTRTIDYGEGDCDDDVVITIGNNIYNISLSDL